LFIKSQFAINVQNILQLIQLTHGHVRSRTATLFRRSSGSCGQFDCHQKYFGKVSVHVKLELNMPGLLCVLTNKNIGG